MKIAVVGATGKAGSLIVKEAAARGHEVTAIVRDRSKITDAKAKVLEKNLFDLTFDDLKENDVVIDAFGTWSEKSLPLHQTSLKHLADILAGSNVRLLVVGGAGSLYADPTHATRIMDLPDFPEAYKPMATNMAKAFDALRVRTDIRWTYFSPAADFSADRPRTGSYALGGEEPVVDGDGKSAISYADYAVAMVDEAESGKHIGKRFTAARK
jgi:putative NADH-flavin reductase